MTYSKLALIAMAASVCSVANAVIWIEVEANETKATATMAGPLVNGDILNGITTGSVTTPGATSLDTWRLSTAVAPLGIYRHRLTITTTGTAGHTGSLRGQTQSAATAGTWPGPVGTGTGTDTSAQSSSTATTPARFNQWYGFGKGEEMYYRITGTASTTGDYNVEYRVDPVTATYIGMYQQGSIQITTIGQGHTTDTDMWVYDSNLNAIVGYGNDDKSANSGGGSGTALQSLLIRNYSPGVYYLAITNFSLTNEMGSPCDDNFRTGAMLDFPNAVLNSSTSTNLNISFAMTDGLGTTQIAATKVGAYDVNFYKFVVVPEPATMAALGLGIIPFLRKRRK